MLGIGLISGAAKRPRSSKKGKGPLSLSAVTAPKQPRLLRYEGKVSFWFIYGIKPHKLHRCFQRQQQNELYDLEREFTQEYFDVLNEYAFPRPRDFFRTDIDRLAQHLVDSRNEVLALTRSISGRSNRQNPSPDYMAETQNLEKKKEILKRYADTIDLFLRGRL